MFTVPFPSKRDHFVGRDEDLEYLHAQLTEGQRTLIGQAASIHGMGGVGKTQLAVEYAHRYRDCYPDGVVWLDTTQPRLAVFAGLATEALGGRTDDKPENLVARAWHWLATHPRCLLVLDNLAEGTKLETWIPPARSEEGLRILATSRHRLGPEWSARSLDRLDRPAAVDLLRHTSGSSGDARCTDADADALCERLCDYPLAIEIAGRYLHRYVGVTVTEYIEDLEARGVRRLSADGNLAATRHRACVVATLALNRERLEDRAPVLAVVEHLATWPSPRVAEELLHRASGITRRLEFKEALSEAWNLSLLQRGEDEHEDERVVRIHAFMQEVVREELGRETVEQHRAAWRRHAREWLAEHRDRGRTGRVQDHSEALRELCRGDGPDADAACVLRELAHHAEIGGQPQEAEDRLAVARSRWSDDLESVEAVRLDLVETKVALLRGRPREALDHVERAERVLRDAATEHPRVWARTLALKAWGQRDSGDFSAAHATAERAHRFAEEHLDEYPEDQARALSDLGVILQGLGRCAEALEHLTCAFEIRTRIFGEAHPDVALARASIGVALDGHSHHRKALEQKTIALSLLTDIFGEEHPDVAHAYNTLGATLYALQQYDDALRHAQRGLDILARVFADEHPSVAQAHSNVGAVLGKMGRDEEALMHYRAAERILEVLPDASPDRLADVRHQRKLASKVVGGSRPTPRQSPGRPGGASPRARSLRKKARRKGKKKKR